MNENTKNYSESAIQGRLVKLRELNFPGWGGKSRFAEALGISSKQYGLYETSRLAPPTVLARVSEVCNIRLEWLITGRGPMEKVEKEGVVMSKIPVKGYRGRAGLAPGARDSVEKVIAEIDNEHGYRGKNIFGVIFTGRSMEPVIPDGAFVIVDPDGDPHPMQVVVYKQKSEPGVDCKLYLGASADWSYFASCSETGQRVEIKSDHLEWIFPSIGVI